MARVRLALTLRELGYSAARTEDSWGQPAGGSCLIPPTGGWLQGSDRRASSWTAAVSIRPTEQSGRAQRRRSWGCRCLGRGQRARAGVCSAAGRRGAAGRAALFLRCHGRGCRRARWKRRSPDWPGRRWRRAGDRGRGSRVLAAQNMTDARRATRPRRSASRNATVGARAEPRGPSGAAGGGMSRSHGATRGR